MTTVTSGTDRGPDRLGGGAANWGGGIYEVFGLIVLKLYCDSVYSPTKWRWMKLMEKMEEWKSIGKCVQMGEMRY